MALVGAGDRWSATLVAPVMATPRISALACVDRAWCLAVGQRGHLWDGTTWRALPASDPTSAPGVELQDVACVSRTFCLAVGSGTFRWDGTSFTPVPGSGPDGSFTRVACAGEGACMAGGRPFAESPQGMHSWTGTAWSPAGTLPRFINLQDVACWSPSGCMAVGEVSEGGEGNGRGAARWDGTAWSTSVVPDLLATRNEWLHALSCPSATRCIAVGGGTNSIMDLPGGGGPVVAEWNGSSWTIALQYSNDAKFTSVSCSDPSWCVAVGHDEGYSLPRPPGRPRGSVWNGVTWASAPAFPSLPVFDDELPLTSVSCVERQCVALAPGAFARYSP
jgi:hypothetical protein